MYVIPLRWEQIDTFDGHTPPVFFCGDEEIMLEYEIRAWLYERGAQPPAIRMYETYDRRMMVGNIEYFAVIADPYLAFEFRMRWC